MLSETMEQTLAELAEALTATAQSIPDCALFAREFGQLRESVGQEPGCYLFGPEDVPGNG